MIIIETCPKCGHDLQDLMLASNPPIHKKECFNCGWSWTGKSEQVVRVPFGGNTWNELENYTLLNCNLDNPAISNYSQPSCLNCPSNPKNGGDGICFCILGQMNVVY